MNTPQATSRSLTFRKLVLSFGLVIISTVYALWQNVSGKTVSSTQNTPSQSYKTANEALLKTLVQINNPTSTPVTSQTALISKPSSPAPTPTPPQSMMAGNMPMHIGMYVDGSYTGSPADAYYGMVQVKAVVQNGRLADVQFLQYPNDRNTSIEINSQAMPLLTQEAIQAQSAQVDGVSGATETSAAFVQSLASALSQAKK